MQNDIILTKPKRNASFELVRIIAMFFIITSHFSGHGGWANVPQGSVNDVFFQITSTLFTPSVDLFVIISAYFLCAKNDMKIQYKKLGKLWLSVFFYSILQFIIFTACKLVEPTPFYIAQSIFPVLLGKYWFFSAYFVMMLFSPLLNVIIAKLSKAQHLALCLAIIVFAALQDAGVLKTMDLAKGYSATWFILLYVATSFLRKYDVKLDNKGLIIGGIAFLAIVVSNYFWRGHYISINTVYMAFFIFLVAKRFPITRVGVSKAICFVSSLVFGVYLIHDSPEIRSVLYTRIIPSYKYIGTQYSFLIFLGFVLATFVVCAIVEWLRQLLFKGVDVACHKMFGDKLALAETKLKDFVQKIVDKINSTDKSNIQTDSAKNAALLQPQIDDTPSQNADAPPRE